MQIRGLKENFTGEKYVNLSDVILWMLKGELTATGKCKEQLQHVREQMESLR